MAAAEHQQWSPEQYAKNARFVSDLGMLGHCQLKAN
jgi:hypothetical protein